MTYKTVIFLPFPEDDVVRMEVRKAKRSEGREVAGDALFGS